MNPGNDEVAVEGRHPMLPNPAPVRRLLAPLATSILLLFPVLPVAGQPCTVRSGDPAVTSTPTSGAAPFTSADFSAALNGAPAVNVTNVAWLPSLPCDAAASWITVAGGSSGLFAVRFSCQPPPCLTFFQSTVASATLTFCFAVDNNLGNGVNQGLFMNGSPIPATTLGGGVATNFTTQTTLASIDVTSMVNGSCDVLYVFLENVSGPSGVIFSATLDVVFGLTTPGLGVCTEVGPNPNVVPQMTGADPLDPFQRNDDGSSAAIPLGFDFCFFGETFTEVYINNNGSLTFGAPYAAYTRVPFPLSGPKMIAPFWADVDTRNPASGYVWFNPISPTRFVVTWQDVGYFDQHVDKCNTFQVMLSNGLDPVVGIGNNVCFCFGSMAWTTGDASGGSGGVGGSPAIVGINVGDGVNAIQVGRFDQPGILYDGPQGANDGVNWLSGQVMCFDTCGCGDRAVPGTNDLTFNGSYSGSGSGLEIDVPVGSVLIIGVTTLPFANVTFMYSLDCICPGLSVPPFGSFHLNIITTAPLFDGCGLFGPPDGTQADSTGNLAIPVAIPTTFAGFCVCVQAIICHPALPASLSLTQAHKVCFQ